MNGSWIETYSGRAFHFEDANPEDVCVEDIAHALSMLNRYTGHTLVPYSVAQHCAIMSQIVPPPFAPWALMHDATEAYLGDVSKPLKSLLPEYQLLEYNLEAVIAERFGLSWPMPETVHEADVIMLATERRDLLNPSGLHWSWTDGVVPLERKIVACGHELAHDMFMDRFRTLFPKWSGA